jgi:AcrR family transcriptional regulator
VPKQKRSAVTRRALLDAAATVFDEQGFTSASLTDIVARAGVTKGALYFHFASKQALADAVVAEMVARWRAMVVEVNARGLDPLWSLLAQTDEVVARKTQDPIARGGIQLVTDPGVVCADAATHYLYGEVAAKEQLIAAAEGGLLRPGVDPTQIARVVVSMITGANLLCDLLRGPNQMWEAVTELWQGLLPGIATDPWLERWRATDWPRRPMPVISGLPGPPH